MNRPTLTTSRLTLRPFALTDAGRVQELAGHRAVADTTLNIPHPYPAGAAEQWIATHQPQFAEGKLCNFAIMLCATGELIGAIGLGMNPRDNNAELGYWIGRPYWGQGYCTEAAQAVVAYGFRELKLYRIHSRHFQRNPASGRVMQKLDMTCEGIQRQHVKKWDQFEDLTTYGLLREEWERARP